MGGQIVDLIDSFTEQANSNTLQENEKNLQELKDLKSQVDGAKLSGSGGKDLTVDIDNLMSA